MTHRRLLGRELDAKKGRGSAHQKRAKSEMCSLAESAVGLLRLAACAVSRDDGQPTFSGGWQKCLNEYPGIELSRFGRWHELAPQASLRW
jgi:hypothetical protein